jgi:hypothetical protein
MRFAYTLTEDEFVEYINQVQPLGSLRAVVRIVAVSAAALCFVVAFASERTATRMEFLAIGLAFVFVAYMSFVISPMIQRRMFRRNPIFSSERNIEFSEAGLTSDTKFQQVTMKWEGFVRWTETNRLFVMYHSENVGSVAPKRLFSPDQLPAFRELLARKIPAR